MKLNSLQLGNVIYVLASSFIATQYLGRYKINNELLDYLIEEINNITLLKFREKNSKEILDNFKTALKKIAIDENFIYKAEGFDLAHLMLLDYEYLFSSQEGHRLLKSFESEKFTLKVKIVDKDNNIIFEVEGFAKINLLFHISGAANLALLFHPLKYKPTSIETKHFLNIVRYLIRGEIVDPLEFVTYFKEVLKNISQSEVDIKNITIKYVVVWGNKEIEFKDNENLGSFINSLILDIIELSEGYFNKKKIYKQFKAKTRKKFMFASTADYLYVKLNSNGEKLAKEDFIVTFIDATIFNQNFNSKHLNEFKVHDIRKGFELYYVEPFLIEFDIRDSFEEELVYDYLIPDPPVYSMFNILNLLKIIFRGIEAILDTAIENYFDVLNTYNELLFIQKTFLTFIEEYRNIRFIGPAIYEIIYEDLKKKLKIDTMYESVVKKMDVLGSIMERHHYVTLKEKESDKKKILLLVQILALAMTTISLLDLITTRWRILNFTTLSNEIFFYFSSILFVSDISLYAFITYFKFSPLKRFIQLPKVKTHGYIILWVLLFSLSSAFLAISPNGFLWIYTSGSLLTLVSLAIIHYWSSKFVHKLKEAYSRI